jgi:uncharacterized protein YjaG (DUF416 family)
MLTFDKDDLRVTAGQLLLAHKIVFGASCCERMLPNYQAFTITAKWGNFHLLRATLDDLWAFTLGNASAMDDAVARKDSILEATPDADDFQNQYTGVAQDAVFSLLHLLECCRDNDPAHIAKIGEWCVESIINYLEWTGRPHARLDRDQVLWTGVTR